MKITKLLKDYGTHQAVAKAVGFSKQAISKWYCMKRIPLVSQIQIEVKTGGKYKADLPASVRQQTV